MEKSSKIRHLNYLLENLIYDEKNIKPIEIALINYSNKILIIVTQMNKMGNIIYSSSDGVPENKESDGLINYDIQTVFGSRDYEEFHELISRGILEILNNDNFLLKELETKGIAVDSNNFINPFKGKPLILSVSLENVKEKKEEYEKFLFQKIVFSIKSSIINFFLM